MTDYREFRSQDRDVMMKRVSGNRLGESGTERALSFVSKARPNTAESEA